MNQNIMKFEVENKIEKMTPPPEVFVLEPCSVDFKDRTGEIYNDRYGFVQKVSLREFYFSTNSDISIDEYPVAMITFRDQTLSKFICLTGKIVKKEKVENKYEYTCLMPRESLSIKRYIGRIFNSKKNINYYNKKINKL